MPRRPGVSTLAVLQAVAAGHEYGFDIMDATGLPGGTVYPALSRLERDGHLSSAWEEAERAHREKRPARRYYRISASGRRLLKESLAWLRDSAGAEAADESPNPDATERT